MPVEVLKVRQYVASFLEMLPQCQMLCVSTRRPNNPSEVLSELGIARGDKETTLAQSVHYSKQRGKQNFADQGGSMAI